MLGTERSEKPVRCAIYCRASDKRDLEYTSVQAQRESCEAYVQSMKHEGWEALDDLYVDDGYSGGNTDRPGLQKLLDAIEAGSIDVVVFYKLDRLSRSLFDFQTLWRFFEKHGVEFVSITQQLNTSNSFGRFMVQILMTFAEFERSMASERTRDKKLAAKKKGLWTGGLPPLGYVYENGMLHVKEDEASAVREMYSIYGDKQSVLETMHELNRRGYRTKAWTTKKGQQRGGQLWTKSKVHRVLTNPLYLGKIVEGENIYEGKHEPIVSQEVFDTAAHILARGRGDAAGRVGARNQHGFLLRGVLRCVHCGTRMTPVWTRGGSGTVHRYYRCLAVDKHGAGACPVGRGPADALERFVVQRVEETVRDPIVVQAALEERQNQIAAAHPRLEAELRRIQMEEEKVGGQMKRLVTALGQGGEGQSTIQKRLVALEQQLTGLKERQTQVRLELHELEEQSKFGHALPMPHFSKLWEVLDTAERERLIHLVVSEAEYDGQKPSLTITFNPLGLGQLTKEFQ